MRHARRRLGLLVTALDVVVGAGMGLALGLLMLVLALLATRSDGVCR